MVLPIKDSDPLFVREAEEPDNINLRGYFLSTLLYNIGIIKGTTFL